MEKKNTKKVIAILDSRGELLIIMAAKIIKNPDVIKNIFCRKIRKTIKTILSINFMVF
jgi:hypothetical protein